MCIICKLLKWNPEKEMVNMKHKKTKQENMKE